MCLVYLVLELGLHGSHLLQHRPQENQAIYAVTCESHGPVSSYSYITWPCQWTLMHHMALSAASYNRASGNTHRRRDDL